MIITNDMRAVIIRMQRTKIDPNYISPNLVADVAWDMGKELTSDQIVYISDNYQNKTGSVETDLVYSWYKNNKI